MGCASDHKAFFLQNERFAYFVVLPPDTVLTILMFASVDLKM